MKEIKINWLTKIIIKFFPHWFFRKQAKKLGVKPDLYRKLHDALAGVRRVDFFPYQSGSRGFIIVLDQKTALYFNQNYDHFVYDGFEMGKYGKGNVTVFDKIKSR